MRSTRRRTEPGSPKAGPPKVGHPKVGHPKARPQKAGAPDPWHGGPDRRADSRFSSWGTAGINILPDGPLVLCYLVDLGLGGCSVDADEAIPACVNACVEVLLQVDQLTLRLAGVIRHMEKKTRAGIGFTDLSLRKVEQVHHLLGILIDEEKQRLAGVKELGG